jgi:hypothetical protein
MCSGNMTVANIGAALIKVFGADHTADAKDITRASRTSTSGKDDAHYTAEVYLADDAEDEEYWDDEDLDQYEEEWWYDEPEYEDYESEEAYYGTNDYEFDDEEGYYDEEDCPEELKEANEIVEESYLSYLDARRKMREIATSRGFYPIFAIADTRGMGDREGRPKGKGKGKGKGKRPRSSTPGAKGRRKGKGKGKGKSPGRRLPSSGSSSSAPLRRRFQPKGKGKSSSSSSSGPSAPAGSTSSGSTQQHGPRFKRFRRIGDGVKPADDAESACLCTLIEYEKKEEIFVKEYILMTQEECDDKNEEMVAHVEEAHYVAPASA